MAQAYFARRSMIQSSEWEKAKMTIENITRFKENLKETALHGRTQTFWLAGRPWPDLTTPEGFAYSDTLRIVYLSIFEDHTNFFEDFEKTFSILDDFAYPIIMGYASEMGSFKSVIKEYYTYGNFILPLAFHESGYKHMGYHAKLLYRLWRVRVEIDMLPSWSIEYISENRNNLLCFGGTEVTPTSLRQYEKKLDKELKKIQKEIEVFRKSSLK